MSIHAEFNHLDYDIYHLGISGGKDSTALLLWIVKESGWPLNRLKVTFCDTGNEDELTYAYIAMLTETIWPLEVITPERDFWELSRWKKRFPSARARFCTSFLKIIPTREYIFSHLVSHKKVLALTGIRKSEAHASNNRGEAEPFDFDEGLGCYTYRPILNWSIDDIWEIHRKYVSLDNVTSLVEMDALMATDKKHLLIKRLRRHGIPRNPLYDMGASRVGCFPCINSRKKEIRAIDAYRPQRIDFIEVQEGSFDNANMYSTLFARNTVPEAHRGRMVTTKDGEEMKVATIRDVVEWSKTKHGGRQYEMDLDVETYPACDKGGYCE